MRNFDEKRVAYLKKRAEVGILLERQEEIHEKKRDIDEWILACEKYDEELAGKIEATEERRDENVATLKGKIKNTEDLISLISIDMKRSDYQREIPENLEEFWNLKMSENPYDKARYEEAINKMGVMLLSTDYAIKDSGDYEKPLRDYIETLNLYRKFEAEYDELVANQAVSENMETLCMILSGNDEKALKLRDRVKDIVGGEDVLKGMLEAYSSYQKALDEEKEAKKDKSLIAETRKTYEAEADKTKKTGKITRKELLSNPVVKEYRAQEEEIEKLEKKIAEKRATDALAVPGKFKEIRALPKEKRKLVEQIINQKIAGYKPESGEKPVSSVEEYYEYVKKAEKAEADLKKLKDAEVPQFPTKADELIKVTSMANVTSKFPELTGALEEYKTLSKKAADDYKKYMEAQVKVDKLPDSFTELSKLKPVNPDLEQKRMIEYNVKVAYMDGLISKANPKIGVDSIAEYLAMAAEVDDLKKQVELQKKEEATRKKGKGAPLTSEEIAKRADLYKALERKEKEAKTVKAAIKATWEADKDRKKKPAGKEGIEQAEANKEELDKAKKEYDQSVKRLEDAERSLLKCVSSANRVIKKEHEKAIADKTGEQKRLFDDSEDKKHFIKRAVMGTAREEVKEEIGDMEAELEKKKAKHAADKSEYDKAINAFYASGLTPIQNAEKENSEKIRQSEQAVRDRKASFEEVCKDPLKKIAASNKEHKAEEAKLKIVEHAEENLRRTKAELTGKGEKLTGLIRGYNERIRKVLKSEVDTKSLDSHFSDYHDAYVNRTIMDVTIKRKNAARKAYLMSAAKYKGLKLALQVMDASTDKLLTTVLTTGQALIKGEAYQARKELNETAVKKSQLSEVSAHLNAKTFRQVQDNSSGAKSDIADTVVREKVTLDSDDAARKEIAKILMQRAAKVKELEEAQSGRIEAFNNSVVSAKEKSGIADPKVREKTDTLRQEIVTEISGTDSVSAKIAEAEANFNRTVETDLLEMEEADKKKFDEKMASVDRFSESFGRLCTPDNMGTLDTVLGVVLSVTNFAIEKINGEKAESEKREPLTKESLIESLKSSIESIPDLKEKKPKDYTLEQVIKLMPALYEKVNGIREYLEDMVSEAESDMRLRSRFSDMCKEEYDSCAQFVKDADPSKEDSLTGNLLELRKKALTDDIEVINTGSEQEIKLYRDAKERLVDKKKEYEARYEEIRDIPHVIAVSKKEEEDLRKESITIFAETLREKRKEPVAERKVEVADVLNEDMDGWEFLSKLTGVEVNSQMTLPDVVRAFEKVYVNGVNAVTYFGLDEDVEKAYLEDAKNEFNGIIPSKSEKAEEVIEKIRVNGLSIKAGLMYVATEDEEKRKSYAHSPLAGQLIGVEDDNMHLCAVEFTDSMLNQYKPGMKEPTAPTLNEIPRLSVSKKRQLLEENRQMTEKYDREKEAFERNKEIFERKKSLIEYNQSVKGVYREFNEMRNEVADMEHKKSLSQDKGKGKDLSKENALGKAILQSRGLDL